MEYMILINSAESDQTPQPGTPEFDQMMAAWGVYNQMLIDGGHWVSGANLAPTSTATTIRKSSAASPVITDGPFAETKEQLGGYYLVRARDLDEVLALAAQIPIPDCSLEVRPVAFRPDAG